MWQGLRPVPLPEEPAPGVVTVADGAADVPAVWVHPAETIRAHARMARIRKGCLSIMPYPVFLGRKKGCAKKGFDQGVFGASSVLRLKT